MFKNYLKIAWRNIRQNKLHSFINIAGLAIAFSVSMLLFLVAYFHFSFDSFHQDQNHLFKTSRFTNSAKGIRLSTNMPLPLGPALQEEIADIESVVRVQRGKPENIRYGDKNIEKVILRTDLGFFSVFNFPIVQGNVVSALSDIQDIALSQTTAKAIFGNENPIGKELEIGETGSEEHFVVSAVTEDAPKNSSIRFDAVARIESLVEYREVKNNWNSISTDIYVKIAKNSTENIVAAKLASLVEKYYPEQLAELKITHPEIKENKDLLSLNLIPIQEVHFSGERSAPKMLMYAIATLGAFILLIACFNFVNLNMARSFKRSRELGVRKTLGAHRGHLFFQLWGEAFLLYFIGFLLGIGIALQLVPTFNAQFGGGIEIDTLLKPGFLAILGGIFILVTLVAGGFPSLKMTNFNLVEILKGNVSTKKPGTLRNSLLVSQFAISSLLICVSVIAGQQLNFIKEKPIGFDRNQIISIPVGNQENGRKIVARMQNELANDPSIVSISGSGGNLGRGKDRVTSSNVRDFEYNQTQVSANWLLTDFDYLKTLQIPIVKGRDFSRDFATDTINAIVVTESFVKAMAEAEPIGKFIGGEDSASGSQIIGIVPDFYAYSPSEGNKPIAMHLSADASLNYVLLKVHSNDPSGVMDKVAAVWEKATEKAEFRASFLDENLQAWYEVERVMTTIFGFASAIAIFLSCLGLFAISLLVIELRTKEIGIRKVMGASVKRIVHMISFQFLKLIFISLLIALPIAWFGLQNWIQDYEYRIELNPLTFIGVGFLVALVAVLTVSYHAIRAAVANPIKSLRTE